MRLGEILVNAGIITRQQLNMALERQVTFGGRLGTNLLELRILTEEKFRDVLSTLYKVSAVTSDDLSAISQEALYSISKSLIEKYKVLPLRKDKKRLHVAVLNPFDEKINELAFISGYIIIPHVISEFRLLDELQRHYGIKSDRKFISFIDRFNPATEVFDSPDILKQSLVNIRNFDELADILLGAISNVAKRVAIFKDAVEIELYKAKGIEVDSFVMPKEESSVFSEAARISTQILPDDIELGEMYNYYRGPLRNDPVNMQLINLLGGAPQDLIVIPIVVSGRIFAFIYADNGNSSSLDNRVAYIAKLAYMGSIALEILVLKKKLSEV